jgi:hypothetical protein
MPSVLVELCVHEGVCNLPNRLKLTADVFTQLYCELF